MIIRVMFRYRKRMQSLSMINPSDSCPLFAVEGINTIGLSCSLISMKQSSASAGSQEYGKDFTFKNCLLTAQKSCLINPAIKSTYQDSTWKDAHFWPLRRKEKLVVLDLGRWRTQLRGFCFYSIYRLRHGGSSIMLRATFNDRILNPSEGVS